MVSNHSVEDVRQYALTLASLLESDDGSDMDIDGTATHGSSSQQFAARDARMLWIVSQFSDLVRRRLLDEDMFCSIIRQILIQVLCGSQVLREQYDTGNVVPLPFPLPRFSLCPLFCFACL